METSRLSRQIILDSKPILLQRIMDYVREGYEQYTSGTVPIDKLARFVRKMELLYQIGCDKHQRCHRKRIGLGNAVLWLYQGPGTETVEWWLMVSPGDHPAQKVEKLRSVEQLSVFGFQVTRETRKNKDKPVMTWRMTNDTYQLWRDSIISSVRSRNVYQMTVMLSELYRLPGFSGIRKRIGQLAVLYRAEVKRHELTGIAPPTPKRLGYVRRLPTKGKTVRQVAGKKGEKSG